MNEKQQAAILAEFTDILNLLGPESKELREFCSRFEEDGELQRLFATTMRLHAQFRTKPFARLSDEEELSTSSGSRAGAAAR